MIDRAFYRHSDHQEIAKLLIGRKVTKVADDTLALDNGQVMRLTGNDGGCACSAGCYDLTELNGVDNIITKVEFVEDPSGDEYDSWNDDDDYRPGGGFYKIFVFADNQKINLATFTGTDGNGYYGTGYTIEVRPARAPASDE